MARLSLACCMGSWFAPVFSLPTIQSNRTARIRTCRRCDFISWTTQGHFHLRPFVYSLKLREGSFDQYEEDTAKANPLRFFVSGARYRLFGLLPSRLHLLRRGEHAHLSTRNGWLRPRPILAAAVWGPDIAARRLLGAGFTLVIGLCVGAAAGYFGGWRDDVLMRVAEFFLALPWFYLLFALRAFLPLSVSPLKAFFLIVAVIGTVGWARPARLVRGVVLSAKERDFVRAARGFGATDIYLLRQHVLPETSSVLLTQAAILIPQYVLAEMTLSFLGSGRSRTRAELGKSALQSSAVQCPGLLLVDVSAGPGNGAVLSRIPGVSEFIAGAS